MNDIKKRGRPPKTDKGVDKSIRPTLGPQIKMDVEPYIRQYPDKKLAIINDLDGDLQRWLDAGAEPVPTHYEGRKVYKGLNDKVDNQWARWPAGEKGNGQTMYAYLLMMDPEIYDDFKLDPIRQRQEDIKKAMYRGKTDEEGKLPSGNNIETYAPNLPTGKGQGYEEVPYNKLHG